MKRVALMIGMLFQRSVFAEQFQGEMCVNCKGLDGPATGIFWIIIFAIAIIALVKLLRIKSAVKKRHL
jgi:uncharacterized membrane protein